MPNTPCSEHTKRQISCESCYSNDELEAQIAALGATRVPSAPVGTSGSKKKPRRLDDPAKAPKDDWRSKLFGDA